MANQKESTVDHRDGKTSKLFKSDQLHILEPARRDSPITTPSEEASQDPSPGRNTPLPSPKVPPTDQLAGHSSQPGSGPVSESEGDRSEVRYCGEFSISSKLVRKMKGIVQYAEEQEVLPSIEDGEPGAHHAILRAFSSQIVPQSAHDQALKDMLHISSHSSVSARNVSNSTTSSHGSRRRRSTSPSPES